MQAWAVILLCLLLVVALWAAYYFCGYFTTKGIRRAPDDRYHTKMSIETDDDADSDADDLFASKKPAGMESSPLSSLSSAIGLPLVSAAEHNRFTLPNGAMEKHVNTTGQAMTADLAEEVSKRLVPRQTPNTVVDMPKDGFTRYLTDPSCSGLDPEQGVLVSSTPVPTFSCLYLEHSEAWSVIDKGHCYAVFDASNGNFLDKNAFMSRHHNV